MKILVVTQNFHPEVAAAPIRLKNMVESLQARGFNVDVLTAMPNYPTGKIFEGYRGKFKMTEPYGNGTLYRYWIYANNSFNKYKRMLGMVSFAATLRFFGMKRKIVRSYDVVIVQTPPLPVAYSAVKMFRRIGKAKIVLNVSDIHPLALVQAGHMKDGTRAYKMFKKMEAYLYRASDALMGQSEEILEFVNNCREMPSFLYRTLQRPEKDIEFAPKSAGKHNKLVYAGLLSKTQDVLSIIENIDFKAKGLEFHLYGDGNQREKIEKHCDGVSVFYHGMVPNHVMMQELQKYDASIVPLASDRTGAVPSKIYNVVYSGMPVLYLGKIIGEAAKLITRYKVGYVAAPKDFVTLEQNIDKFCALTEKEYQELVNNCIDLSQNDFSFDKQMERFDDFLHKL